MVKDKRLLIGYKLFFGLLGLSALITEIVTLTERNRFNAVNFFSYFTVECNVLVCVALMFSALAVAKGKNEKLDELRAAVTVYTLVVGIGFSVLLAGLDDVALTAVPWDNTVLHYIMPVAVLIDYIIDRPKRKLQFKQSVYWLWLPVAYLFYSLARGAMNGWYPYPFLNPDENGYGSIAGISLGLLVIGLGLVWVICKYSGKSK